MGKVTRDGKWMRKDRFNVQFLRAQVVHFELEFTTSKDGRS